MTSFRHQDTVEVNGTDADSECAEENKIPVLTPGTTDKDTIKDYIEFIMALDTLDDEHLSGSRITPRGLRGLENPWSKIFEGNRQRLEVEIDEGTYHNAVIHTPDGETHPAGEVHLRTKYLVGRYNADIKERNVPPEVDLEECKLEILFNDGVPLLHAATVDEPSETLGNSLCPNSTRVVQPTTGCRRCGTETSRRTLEDPPCENCAEEIEDHYQFRDADQHSLG